MIELEFPEEYKGIAVMRLPRDVLEDRKSGSTIADNLHWQLYKLKENNANVVALDLKEFDMPISATYAAIGIAYVVCDGNGYKLVCFNLNEHCKERYVSFNLHSIIHVYDTLEEIVSKEIK